MTDRKDAPAGRRLAARLGITRAGARDQSDNLGIKFARSSRRPANFAFKFAPDAGVKPTIVRLLSACAVAAGLATSTYLLVAFSNFVPPATAAEDPCPNAHFRTGPSRSLPDCRAFELVSPPIKGGPEVHVTGDVAVSTSGDRIFYTSDGAFPGAEAGGPGANLADRTETGWTSRSIWPRRALFPTNPRSAYEAFTPDLSHALLRSSDIPLSDEQLGTRDLYLRNNSDDSYSLVTTQPQVEPNSFGHPEFIASTADLEHVLFEPSGNDSPRYFPDVPLDSIYSARGGAVTLASLIPDETTSDPDDEMAAPSASVGAGTNPATGGKLRAISADGSRFVFTAADNDGGLGVNSSEPSRGAQLYLRENHGTPAARSVHVSAPEPGVTEPTGLTWPAWFRAASADGQKIFFTSCQRLTADATTDATGGSVDFRGCTEDPSSGSSETKSDLYLFDVATRDLTDLTTADPTGAEVIGVLGSSEDGSRVYFVATGVLDDGAVSGQPNLYIWRAGQGIGHIATLGFDDADAWLDPVNRRRDSRISADGRFLAFASRQQLDPSFDNAGHRAVYVFDALGDQLTCISCRGAGPATADASLGTQGSTNSAVGDVQPSPQWEKQNLSENGRYVFFESAEPLTRDDENESVDVYRYSSTDHSVELLSGGHSPGGSLFAGATEDGRTAFFTTRSRLVGWDRDDAIDMYAARVGGGFPEPVGAIDCGLDCQGPPATAPDDPDTGTASLVGPGNPTPEATDCSRLERKAKRASEREKRLNQKAKKASGEKAERLKKKAKKAKKKAEQLKEKAERCKGGSQ